MRKSSVRTHNFRPGTSRGRGSPSTFRAQMADYVRGDVLKELRLRRGESQETVAFNVGVSTKTVRAWEKSGAIKPTRARTLAAYFEKEPGDLTTPEWEEIALPNKAQLDRIEADVAALRAGVAKILMLLGSDDLAARADRAIEETAPAVQAPKPPARAQSRAAASTAKDRAATGSRPAAGPRR